MEWLWAIVLVLVSGFSWLLNLVNLPGNWGVVLLAALYAWLGPPDAAADLGWQTVGVLVALAALGEGVEFIASAAGARRAGGSRRSSLYALAGSIIGGVLGVVVGVPIPIVGPIVAAVMFASLGAMAGAVYGEWSSGKEWSEAMPVGQAAFWGRLWGTAGKFACGGVMLVALVAGLVF